MEYVKRHDDPVLAADDRIDEVKAQFFREILAHMPGDPGTIEPAGKLNAPWTRRVFPGRDGNLVEEPLHDE